MRVARLLALSIMLSAILVTVTSAAAREEHVTGGVLDLPWLPGLLLPGGAPLPNVMHAAILDPSDPA